LPKESTRPKIRGFASWWSAPDYLGRRPGHISTGEGWRPELEGNRKLLLEHGLWGVPSFRLVGEDGEPDYCTWGQDRIWRVEEEIRRRLGSPAS
jgi:hypothetical protein